MDSLLPFIVQWITPERDHGKKDMNPVQTSGERRLKAESEQGTCEAI